MVMSAHGWMPTETRNERRPSAASRHLWGPKAYENLDFLKSRNARSLRILSEYLEPLSRFEHYEIDDTIVFMGSARLKTADDAAAMVKAAEAGEGDLETA